MSKELRTQKDLQFFEDMLKQQAASTFGPEQFLEMVFELRRPFRCTIEGRGIEISEQDCALMMKNEVTEMLNNKVLVTKRKEGESNNYNDDGPNKRRCTGRNATVCTVLGADCFTDKNSCRKEREAKRKKLVNEDKEIKTILEAIQC